MWYYLLIFLFILLTVFVVFTLFRDRSYRKKRTVETIGKDLWNDIERERENEIEKGRKFRRVMKEKMKEEK